MMCLTDFITHEQCIVSLCKVKVSKHFVSVLALDWIDEQVNVVVLVPWNACVFAAYNDRQHRAMTV